MRLDDYRRSACPAGAPGRLHASAEPTAPWRQLRQLHPPSRGVCCRRGCVTAVLSAGTDGRWKVMHLTINTYATILPAESPLDIISKIHKKSGGFLVDSAGM